MEKIERFISSIPLRLIEWPKLCCLLTLLLTALLIHQMGQVRFDSSIEGFLEEQNPTYQAYFDFKDEYGQSEYFILLIRSNQIFTPQFKQNLDLLSQDIIRQVPYVDDVETIANSRHIKSQNDFIQVGSLFDDIETYPQWVMRDALTNPYYVNRLINTEGDVTVILIRLIALIESPDHSQRIPLDIKNGTEALSVLKQVVKQHQPSFSEEIVIGGSPMATVELTNKMKQDIMLFSVLGILVVSIFLMVFFRRFSAVFLPVISLLFAVSITMSLMVIGRYPIQVTSTILPSFLLAVCVGDAVHFLKSFYRKFDGGMRKKTALRHAIRATGSAMFFTTFMTSVGLLSFAHSAIKPISSFGVFSAVGVWLALLLTLIVLPSMMLLIPIRRRLVQTEKEAPAWLLRYVSFLRRYAMVTVILSAGILLSCFYLSTKLDLSHDALSWLKPDNKTRQAVELVDKELSGTMQVELLIEASGEPLTAAQFEKLDQWLQLQQSQSDAAMPIRSVNSIIDLLKQMNAVFDSNQKLALPQNNALLAQELLMLDLNAAEDVARLCNSDCSRVRVTLTTPWKDAVYYTDFLDQLDRSFAQQFDGELSLEITGMANIVNRTFTEMLSSMFVSYLLAASLVSVLMIAFVRHWRLGLLLMLPNLLPVFCVLALMYAFSMPLDLFSLLMGSIAIGLIVDDSVHLVSAFRRYFSESQDVEQAVAFTLQKTGSALLITTCVLCAGFLTYLFSDLQNIANFGLLTSICIGLALLADVTVAPAILMLVYQPKAEHVKRALT